MPPNQMWPQKRFLGTLPLSKSNETSISNEFITVDSIKPKQVRIRDFKFPQSRKSARFSKLQKVPLWYQYQFSNDSSKNSIF